MERIGFLNDLMCEIDCFTTDAHTFIWVMEAITILGSDPIPVERCFAKLQASTHKLFVRNTCIHRSLDSEMSLCDCLTGTALKLIVIIVNRLYTCSQSLRAFIMALQA